MSKPSRSGKSNAKAKATAARGTLEARLAVVRALGAEPTSAATREALTDALADPSCHVVAAAARHAATHGLRTLGGALVDAYFRFAEVGYEKDRNCTAKLAVAAALHELDHPDPRPHLHGVHHVQLEPAFGDPVDTAVALRCASLAALGGLSDPSFPGLAAERLADPEPHCRSAAARALEAWGDRDLGQALLRFRIRVGEDDPDVLADCFAAVIALGDEDAVRFVVRELEREGAALVVAESAALALGSARIEAALPALFRWVDAQPDEGSRKVGFVAIGLVRCEAALAHLLDRLAEAGPRDRAALLDALEVYAHDPAAAERIRQATER